MVVRQVDSLENIVPLVSAENSIARVDPDTELWKVLDSFGRDGAVATQKYKLALKRLTHGAQRTSLIEVT